MNRANIMKSGIEKVKSEGQNESRMRMWREKFECESEKIKENAKDDHSWFNRINDKSSFKWNHDSKRWYSNHKGVPNRILE